MPPPTFEEQRKIDPQGVIDNLLAQTKKQGAEIHKLLEEIKFLKNPKLKQKTLEGQP